MLMARIELDAEFLAAVCKPTEITWSKVQRKLTGGMFGGPRRIITPSTANEQFADDIRGISRE
jgi:hypothetical protein